MRKALDASQVDEDDEGGSASGSIVTVSEARGVPGNAEADDEERGEVDDRDTPKSALDSPRESLARIWGLGRCESNQLGTRCIRFVDQLVVQSC